MRSLSVSNASHLFQLPYTTDNGRGEDGGECSHGVLDEAEDDAADVELPPPMKPIQVTLHRNLTKPYCKIESWVDVMESMTGIKAGSMQNV